MAAREMSCEERLVRAHGIDDAGFLRCLLQSLPAPVAYVAGADLVFGFANEEYCRVAGRPDLVGRPYREALPGAAYAARLATLRHVLEVGEPVRTREQRAWARQPGAAPEATYIDWLHRPVHDTAGEVAGVLFVGSDVSDHVADRHALEALTVQLGESEGRYRTLFETLPPGVVYCGDDGAVLDANPAACRLAGATPATPAGPAGPLFAGHEILDEHGAPVRHDDLPHLRALRTGEVVSDVLLAVRPEQATEERWLRVTAVPDARDPGAGPRHAYAVLTDVTEQHRAERALLEHNRLLERLQEANVLGVVVADETGIQEANDAFLEIVGFTRHDLDAGRITWDAITPPAWATVDAQAVEQLRRNGTCPLYEKEHLHRDGHRVPTLVGAALLDRAPLRWAKFVVDLTARQRQEQERAELQARAHAARAAAEATSDRLDLLLRAGELVAATGNRKTLVERVARLVVPTLADHCVVILPTPDGSLRVEAVVDRDPERAAIFERLLAVDLAPAGPTMPQIAFSQATTQLWNDDRAEATPLPPEVRQVLALARPRSAIATPLLLGRRPVGVLVLGRNDEHPRFCETDVPVVTELARRLATALANVETFAREHTIAETLQHALLPDSLPTIPGLDLAVRYLPATGGVQVGGDWYDVFPLGHDQIGLTVGDVVGHSIDSASRMGQIRSMLRTCAVEDPAPPEVLRRTNAAMAQLLPDVLATAFYAVLDSRTGELAYACAGHPPALATDETGHASFLGDAPGLMLGARTDTTYRGARRQLPAGARLLLYTDGLIEARDRDLFASLDALALALQRSSATTAEQTCDSVLAALLSTSERADDVCLLALHHNGDPARRRSRPPPQGTVA